MRSPVLALTLLVGVTACGHPMLASGSASSPMLGCDLATWRETHREVLSGVVPADSLDAKLQVTSNPMPIGVYPTSAERGFDAYIRVAIVVDTAGRVGLADVLDMRILARTPYRTTDPEVEADFRRSALATVQPTIFSRPFWAGRPVKVLICVPVNFTGG